MQKGVDILFKSNSDRILNALNWKYGHQKADAPPVPGRHPRVVQDQQAATVTAAATLTSLKPGGTIIMFHN